MKYNVTPLLFADMRFLRGNAEFSVFPVWGFPVCKHFYLKKELKIEPPESF
jgi:hypothetical protein